MKEAFLRIILDPYLIFGVTSIVCTLVSVMQTRKAKTFQREKKGGEGMKKIRITLKVPTSISKLLDDGKISLSDLVALALTCEDVQVSATEVVPVETKNEAEVYN